MKSQEVADRYATAVYELGKEEGILEDLLEELEEVGEVVQKHEDMAAFLEHPLIPEKRKYNLIEEIFGPTFRNETLNFLKLLVKNHRESYLSYICSRVRDIWAEREDVLRVEIITPPEFDTSGLEDRVSRELEELSGKKVLVTGLSTDEELIGGLKLRVGDKVLDGSVESRLDQLRESLLKGG
mgnify:CR=1 FL=1